MKAKKAAAPDPPGPPPPARGPCEALGAEIDKLLAAVAPSEDVRAHLRNAAVELLKAIRALIDERIERYSAEPRKGTSIPVE